MICQKRKLMHFVGAQFSQAIIDQPRSNLIEAKFDFEIVGINFQADE